jgi:hypothetical protein
MDMGAVRGEVASTRAERQFFGNLVRSGIRGRVCLACWQVPKGTIALSRGRQPTDDAPPEFVQPRKGRHRAVSPLTGLRRSGPFHHGLTPVAKRLSPFGAERASTLSTYPLPLPERRDCSWANGQFHH